MAPAIVPLRAPRLLLWWERAFWVAPLSGVVCGYALHRLVGAADELAFVERLYPGRAAHRVVLPAHPVHAGHPRDLPPDDHLIVHVAPRDRVREPSGLRTQLSVAMAFLLLFASLVAFVLLLSSVGGRIRVDAVLSALGRQARRPLVRRLGGAPPEDDSGSTDPAGPAGAPVRYRGHGGQPVAVDTRRLVRLAQRTGCRITVALRVGDAVSAGVEVGRVAGGSADVEAQVLRCLVVDVERSLRYDALYALRLVVDVALRALSAAVNDPTTAVRAIDEVESVLRTAATIPLGPQRFFGGEGSVVVHTSSWSGGVDLGLMEIVECGHGQPQVSRRLAALFADFPEEVEASRRAVVGGYRDRLVALVSAARSGDEATRALTPDRQGLGGSR